jgi:multiple sugar transport system ATP-binding protein
MNVFQGVLKNGKVEALGVDWPASGARAGDGRRVTYGIRPEHIELAGAGIAAEVVVVEPMGAETELLVRIANQTLTLITHGRASAGPGERVFLAPQAQHAHLFDAATGQRV